MRFLFALVMLLATVMAPTQALPSSTVVCDVGNVAKHAVSRAATANTRVTVSSATVTAGSPTTITVSNTAGGFGGLLLYVRNAANTHVGTFGGTLATGSKFCTNGAPTGSTISHSSAALRASSAFTWTAPTTPGTYTVTAMVAESPTGLPTLFNVAPVTITVAAAVQTQAPTQPPTQAPTQATQAPSNRAPTQATTAPTQATTTPRTTTAPVTTTAPATTTAPDVPNPTKAPTAPNTAAPSGTTRPPKTPRIPATPAPGVKDAYNMVLVTVPQTGTGTTAQLGTTIKNLMTQIQTAIQAAKAANGAANPNVKVKMIVIQSTAAGAGNGAVQAAATTDGGGLNFRVGFADTADAVLFAELVAQASDPATRDQSPLTTAGDLAAQLQADPNGIDTTTGTITVTDPQQVQTVTCLDGTLTTSDMKATLCPQSQSAAVPAAGANTNTPTLSNGAFIGIIIGGCAVLLMAVGGLMYYQKAKTKYTVAPRV